MPTPSRPGARIQLNPGAPESTQPGEPPFPSNHGLGEPVSCKVLVKHMGGSVASVLLRYLYCLGPKE